MKITPSLIFRLVLCAFSACLVWFSFPNFLDKNLEPKTAFWGWIFDPLLFSFARCWAEKGSLSGFCFGFLYFGGILYWIAFLEEAKYLSGLAWFVLVFYLSLYFSLFGFLYCYLKKRLKSLEVWTAPFLWVALEYIRGSRPWGGFNWGELGYSQAPYPTVLVLTTLGGVYGLTFLMVWFNASLAKVLDLVFLKRNSDPKFTALPRTKLIALFLPAILLLFLLVFGNHVTQTSPLKKVGSVVLLQPSIDQSVKWSKSYEAETYEKLAGLVEGIKGPKPDLVVWPESAAPSFLLSSPIALEKVKAIVRRANVPQLVGCLDIQRTVGKELHYYNGAVQFDANGKPEGAYHKRHLVPFGEFVPFQNYLNFLGPVIQDLGTLDFGQEYVKFNAPGFSFTPMICYEVIFPGDVQKAFETGADALVNISNDAWYGRTASAYQHVMMAVVRSAEERKPLLRAANTGISLVADPFGRILSSSRLFEETTIRADVMTLPAEPTFYARHGNWLPRFCWLVVALLGLMAVFKKPGLVENGIS